jgi:hypothetical protein
MPERLDCHSRQTRRPARSPHHQTRADRSVQIMQMPVPSVTWTLENITSAPARTTHRCRTSTIPPGVLQTSSLDRHVATDIPPAARDCKARDGAPCSAIYAAAGLRTRSRVAALSGPLPAERARSTAGLSPLELAPEERPASTSGRPPPRGLRNPCAKSGIGFIRYQR